MTKNEEKWQLSDFGDYFCNFDDEGPILGGGESNMYRNVLTEFHSLAAS
jgi:hypothetical protein